MCGFTQVVREGTLNGWCIQKATPAVQGVDFLQGLEESVHVPLFPPVLPGVFAQGAQRVNLELDHRPRTFADGGRESATIEGPCFQLRALVCYPFRDLLWSEVCL